ncbi:MAG: MtrB/PioB family decaheme-associated outer membrane protein [Gammaproteobacteria bacterium]|nr:MtrB/PioB family decaheme-associated outer membrane protein [Gammaproteobacteria bacterium]
MTTRSLRDRPEISLRERDHCVIARDFAHAKSPGANSRGRQVITALVTMLVLCASPALGAWGIEPNYAKVDLERWQCSLCPFETASYREGEWLVGAVHVAEAEPRFGRDSGLDKAGSRAKLGIGYRSMADDGMAVGLDGTDLGLHSRAVRLHIRDPQRFEFRLAHRGLPRRVSNDGRVPYGGRTSLALPMDWIRAFDSRDLTALRTSGSSVNHATQRDRTSATVRYLGGRRWWAEAGLSRETKEGTEETFADFLYQATALPKPIEHRTEENHVSIGFDHDRLLVTATYRSARFRNRDEVLEWDNPWRGPAVPQGRKALAPDNDADTLSLVSRARIGRRTTAHATLTRSEVTQNDPFLPYTTNSAIAIAPLRADNLAGRITTFAGTFNLASQVTDRVRVSIRHQTRDRDNHTPTLTLTPVLGDAYVPATVTSRAYSFDTAKTEARVHYALTNAVKVELGADTSRIRRNATEVRGNDGRRSWATVTANSPGGLQVRIGATSARRSATDFVPVTNNNPLTRRFHQAARRQREWTAGVRYERPEMGLSLGLQANDRRARYPESTLGLGRNDDSTWSGDITYTPNPRVTAIAYFSTEESSSLTVGSPIAQPEHDARWRYTSNDTVDTTGASLVLRGFLQDRLELELDYVRSNGGAHYVTERMDEPSYFPTLVSDLESLDVRLRYRWQNRSTVVVRYRRDDYRAADWAFLGSDLDAVRNLIPFGRAAPDYVNGLFSLSLETAL